MNVLIEKKLKKAFKGRKKCKQELRTFQKMDVSGSEQSDQSLMYLVKAMTSEA